MLNTTGFNETFPSIRPAGAVQCRLEYGAFAFNGFRQLVCGYSNWSSSTVAAADPDANGTPMAAAIR